MGEPVGSTEGSILKEQDRCSHENSTPVWSFNHVHDRVYTGTMPPRRNTQPPNYVDEVFDLPCDECGGFMKLKRSHVYNTLFYGCETWPTCTNAFSASQTGKPLPGQDNRPQPTESKPELPDSYPCECGGNQILRWSHRRQGWFYGCSTYPKCNITYPPPPVDRWCLLRQTEETEEPPKPPSKGAQKRARQRARKEIQQFRALLDDF